MKFNFLSALWFSLWTGILLLLPNPPYAQSEPIPQKEVKAKAREMEFDSQKNLLLLKGDVIVTLAPWEIKADQLEVDLTRELVCAKAGIKVFRKEGEEIKEVLSAQQMEIKMDGSKAWILEGELKLPVEPIEVTISGSRLIREGEKQYRIEKGEFSICECPEGKRADWSIYAENLKLDEDKSVRFSKARILIKGESIFYVPFFEYPTGAEPKTGFLLPSFDYSNRSGYYMTFPYYLSLSRSADFTFMPGYFSKRGIQLGGEARYNLGNLTKAEIFYQGIDDSEEDIYRWAFYSKGESSWESGWVRSDIRLISDNEYIYDFPQKLVSKRSRDLKSKIVLSQQFEKLGIAGEVKWFDDISGADLRKNEGITKERDEELVQILPQIKTQIYKQPIWGPIGWELFFQGDNFYREREELGAGAKLSLTPRLIFEDKIGQLVECFFSAGERAELYLPTSGFSDTISTSLRSEANAELSIAADRIYMNPSGRNRYRHLVRPSVFASYLSPADEPEDMFFKNSIDIKEKGLVGLRLTNYLFSRSNSEPNLPPRLLARMELTQYYDWVVDEFADLELELTSEFPFGLGATTNGLFNWDKRRFDRLEMNIFWKSRDGNKLWLSYVLDEGNFKFPFYKYFGLKTNDLSLGTQWKVSERLSLSYDLGYSLEYAQLVEQMLGFDYTARQKCWGIIFGFSQNIHPEDPEKSPDYGFSLNLKLADFETL